MNLKLVAALGFLALGCYCFYLKWQLAECQKEPLQAAVTVEQRHAKTQAKIYSLTDAQLMRRFCKFVRAPYDECLQSDILLNPRSPNSRNDAGRNPK